MNLKALCLTALAALALTLSTDAQIVPGTLLYESDFTGENGTTPVDWGSYTSGSNTMHIQGNYYEFRRVSSGAAMFGWYAGEYQRPEGAPLPASEWDNYTIDAVFRSSHAANTGTRTGLILRWQEVEELRGLNQGYHGMVTFIDAETVTLSILKDFGIGLPGGDTGDGGGTVLKSEDFAFSLGDRKDYRLSFQGAGSELTLTISTMDNSISHSISISDSSYTQGNPGMRVYHASNTRWTSFGEFNVTSSIPEPSSVALGVTTLGALLLGGRRLVVSRD